MKGPETKAGKLMASGVALLTLATGGRALLLPEAYRNATPLRSSTSVSTPRSESGANGVSYARKAIDNRHEMLGIGTSYEYHCTMRIFKQESERDPGRYVLSFNTAPNMLDVDASRPIDDAKAELIENNDPETVKKTFPLIETITFHIVEGKKVMRRHWEAVTQLDQGTSVIRVSAKDLESGERIVVNYEVFVPSAA